jgi:SAM-dependent methyltransferase
MTSDERWLAAIWPLVRGSLPLAPARVLELGCGALGGFVPMLLSSGYEATGIDPNAPDEEPYQRVEFERADLPERVDAVVASVSLHHVADPTDVIGRIARVLVAGGTVIVVEWASEDFDEATARWAFERLGSADGHGWLHRHRERWASSGEAWDTYFSAWARSERIHAGAALLRELERHFEREHLNRGPYVFADLSGTTEADEQSAIDRGEIRASRIDYVGRLPTGQPENRPVQRLTGR